MVLINLILGSKLRKDLLIIGMILIATGALIFAYAFFGTFGLYAQTEPQDCITGGILIAVVGITLTFVGGFIKKEE